MVLDEPHWLIIVPVWLSCGVHAVLFLPSNVMGSVTTNGGVNRALRAFLHWLNSNYCPAIHQRMSKHSTADHIYVCRQYAARGCAADNNESKWSQELLHVMSDHSCSPSLPKNWAVWRLLFKECPSTCNKSIDAPNGRFIGSCKRSLRQCLQFIQGNLHAKI